VYEFDMIGMYTMLSTLLMLGYILFEQPLPPTNDDTDAFSIATTESAGAVDLNNSWQSLMVYLGPQQSQHHQIWTLVPVCISCWKGFSASLVILLLSFSGEIIDERGMPQASYTHLGAGVLLVCGSLMFASSALVQRYWPWPSFFQAAFIAAAAAVVIYLIGRSQLEFPGGILFMGPLCTSDWKLMFLNTALATVIGMVPDLILRAATVCRFGFGSMISMDTKQEHTEQLISDETLGHSRRDFQKGSILVDTHAAPLLHYRDGDLEPSILAEATRQP
jgi:hypothetical protein